MRTWALRRRTSRWLGRRHPNPSPKPSPDLNPKPNPNLNPNPNQVEAQTAELAGKAGLAAQREAWAEVMDCGTELEQMLKGRANQVACNVCSAKALLQAGLKS